MVKENEKVKNKQENGERERAQALIHTIRGVHQLDFLDNLGLLLSLKNFLGCFVTFN